ncbi:MAG: hypothetical protein H0U74_19705 [Bradymonadaceae bacterium]|nr:hypothetical protein [Lujinxingiaceae bacterium]
MGKARRDWPSSDLALAAEQGVELLMPRFGQPVEPERAEGVEPWWRA